MKIRSQKNKTQTTIDPYIASPNSKEELTSYIRGDFNMYHTPKRRFIDMVKHNNQTTASKRSDHTAQSSKTSNDPSTPLKPNKLQYRLSPSADETHRRRRTDQLFPLTAAIFFFFFERFFQMVYLKVLVQISFVISVFNLCN